MIKRLFVLFPSLLVIAVVSMGCASHKAYVLARRDGSYSPSPASKIAIVNNLKPRPEDQTLCVALMAELKQQGFRIVSQEEAEFTLSYWIEDNWHERKVPVRTYDSPGYDPRFSPGPMPSSQLYAGGTPPGAIAYQSPTAGRVTETMVDDPVAVQGIRLKLHSRDSARAGRLETAWEGYIDGGFKVVPEREPILLRTLLTYFGKDYTGRARLVK